MQGTGWSLVFDRESRRSHTIHVKLNKLYDITDNERAHARCLAKIIKWFAFKDPGDLRAASLGAKVWFVDSWMWKRYNLEQAQLRKFESSYLPKSPITPLHGLPAEFSPP